MYIMATLSERVRMGINWLDNYDPDWFWIVNPDMLDMVDGMHCVLAQVTGKYWWEATETLQFSKEDTYWMGFDACVAGWYASEDPYDEDLYDRDWLTLTRLWRYAIHKRRMLLMSLPVSF